MGYTNDFFIPYLPATQYFQRVEVGRLQEEAPADSIQAHLGLLENNLELMTRSLNGPAVIMKSYTKNETDQPIEALKQVLFELIPPKISIEIRTKMKCIDDTFDVEPEFARYISPQTYKQRRI